MVDPFRKISVFDKEQTPFENDPDFDVKEDPPTQVRIPCKKCPAMCVRSDLTGEWVHEDEVVAIAQSTKKGIALHAADPNIIEVEEVDAEPSGELGASSRTEREA